MPERPRGDPPFEPPPAPVVTPEGAYGDLPPPRRYALDGVEDRGGSARTMGTWLAAIALTVVTLLWLLALSASHMTAESVALPVLERGVMALTDVDALLEIHREELAIEGEDRAGATAAAIEVPGFPVQGATLTPAQASEGTIPEMQEALLGQSARLIYENGLEVMLVEDSEPAASDLFSTAGGARLMMDSLSATNHDRATFFLWPLGIAALVLGGIVLLIGRGVGRFLVLGLAVLVAAIPVGLLGLGLNYAAPSMIDGEGELANEFSTMVETLTWAPVRNALFLGGAGLALLLPAAVLAALFDRSSVRRDASGDADWEEPGDDWTPPRQDSPGRRRRGDASSR